MKIVKRISSFVIFFAILVSTVAPMRVQAAYSVPFEVFSDTAILISRDTGTVVYEKNPDKKTYPASLTKIMTAIVALEQVQDLEGTVVTAPGYIFDEFYGISVSNADIGRGEDVRMIDLLYALIVPSACEAASIIADYVGNGDIQTFVDMMNEKAKQLGAVNTTFMNAHGLYHPEQVTTSRDMAIITEYAMSFPVFEKICGTSTYEMPVTNKHDATRYITHTNVMMSKLRGGEAYYYEPIRGVKTGSIDEVGKNLVSTATLNGYNYLLVTMGASAKDANGVALPRGTNRSFDDAKAIYNWAFANFSEQKVIKENEVVDEVPVKLASERDYVTLVARQDVSSLLPNDVQPTAIQKTRTLAENVVAPVKKGTVLGRMELKLADAVIATVDLVAANDVERNEMLYWLNIAKDYLMKPQVIVLLLILIILFFLYIALTLRYKQLKRRRDARTRQISR